MSEQVIGEKQTAALTQALREQPNYLMEKYNSGRGGIYVPPHKLRAIEEQMQRSAAGSNEHQRLMWQLLRKSINGMVNKVNTTNIQNVVVELLNENILRGKGLLARAVIKAQMAAPNFTHVYACLIAIVNSKLPEVGNLVLRRVMAQFKRSFERNNKIVCIATIKMLAHLFNQRVLGEYAVLQLLYILLNNPTHEAVEIACDFMLQAGQILCELTPAGATAVFQRFKSLLHESNIDQKTCYCIESLFAVRKTAFKEHPGLIQQLDLVELDQQITHNMDFQEQIDGEQSLNMFCFDAEYEKHESEWEAIKQQILGEENISRLKSMPIYEEEGEEEAKEEEIKDLTETDLINLRKAIYLVIQSTVSFEECAHKILKMQIAKGYEHQLVDMILQCSMVERVYQAFSGLLAERLCLVQENYKELFVAAFIDKYNVIFKLEGNKIRNLAKLYAHLFARQSLPWSVFECISLTPQTTTAAGRVFLKVLLKEIAEKIGVEPFWIEIEQHQHSFRGMFPIDHPNNLRFAINYYTSIGLGRLSQNMRQILTMQEEIIANRKQLQQDMERQMILEEEEELLLLAKGETKIQKREQSPPTPRNRNTHNSRNPFQKRSRTPIRNRSRTPVRNRSRTPVRNRSRTPIRNRSKTPVRNRSRTPDKENSITPVKKYYKQREKYQSQRRKEINNSQKKKKYQRSRSIKKNKKRQNRSRSERRRERNNTSQYQILKDKKTQHDQNEQLRLKQIFQKKRKMALQEQQKKKNIRIQGQKQSEKQKIKQQQKIKNQQKNLHKINIDKKQEKQKNQEKNKKTIQDNNQKDSLKQIDKIKKIKNKQIIQQQKDQIKAKQKKNIGEHYKKQKIKESRYKQDRRHNRQRSVQREKRSNLGRKRQTKKHEKMRDRKKRKRSQSDQSSSYERKKKRQNEGNKKRNRKIIVRQSSSSVSSVSVSSNSSSVMPVKKPIRIKDSDESSSGISESSSESNSSSNSSSVSNFSSANQ